MSVDCAYSLGALRGHMPRAYGCEHFVGPVRRLFFLVGAVLWPQGAFGGTRAPIQSCPQARTHAHGCTRTPARPLGCTRARTHAQTRLVPGPSRPSPRARQTLKRRTSTEPHARDASSQAAVSARSGSEDHCVCQWSAAHFPREPALACAPQLPCAGLDQRTTMRRGAALPLLPVPALYYIIPSATETVHSPGADAGRAQPAQLPVHLFGQQSLRPA
jgi:hypothetical protein